MQHLHAMKVWAQQEPVEFREEAMKMSRSKAKANKTPATGTPKRKRKYAVDNVSDREDDHEDNESSVGESESEGDNISRRPTRGRKTHKTALVTPATKARQTGEEPALVGARLYAISKEQ